MDAPDADMVECPKCGKHFKRRELACHRRKCDIVDLNNEVVLKKEKNPHWSTEETYFLARSEADTILKGVKAKYICGYLIKLHKTGAKR